jgi:hypothetical protein
MATIVDRRTDFTRPHFPWISWGAIFGGLAAGLATFILLAMLGLAVGITAIDPQATEPVGRVPAITGIWTGISMILAAFVGGYVAARMSGMSRRSDGLFHGFVAWGVITLAMIYLVTTSVGALLGGTLNILGQGMQAVGAVTGAAADGQQLETMITGSPGVEVTPEALSSLQQQLSAGDREGAINTMVTEMGFTRDRAEPIVDQGMALLGAAQQVEGQEVAAAAVEGLSRAAWFIFAGLFLSLLLGVAGGWVGAQSTVKRRGPAIAH